MHPTGSALISALEIAYADIRERHPELPDAVFITGSGAKARRMRLGHFCAERWHHADGRKHEIFVSGEGMAAGAAGVMTTLLHESTHALASTRGIKDTSRDGRWHNRRFLALAQELGLHYPHEGLDSSIGFSDVMMTEITEHAYKATIATLDNALVAHLVRHPVAENEPSASRALKAVCPCERIIRASASVLEDAPITCGACGGEFEQE